MEGPTPNLWDRLRQVKFQKFHLVDSTSGPIDGPETEIPLTTIPDFTRQLDYFSATAAFEFLRHLPLISCATLADDKQACNICYEPYESGKHAEMPTKLPCQHVFGRRCIGKWILPENAQPTATCPMCRSELFSRHRFIISLTSTPEEGDAADWIRETSLLYQGDPNAEERIEVLVEEIERVGRMEGTRMPVARANFLRGFASQIDGAVGDIESRIGALMSRHRIAEDGGEQLSPSDRIALDHLRGSMTRLLTGSQGIRTMVQTMFAQIQEIEEGDW